MEVPWRAKELWTRWKTPCRQLHVKSNHDIAIIVTTCCKPLSIENTRKKYPVNSIPDIFVAVDDADAELLDNTRKGLGPRLNSAPKEQRG